MKRTLKSKLTIHRETLRHLENQALYNAAGGGSLRTCGNTCDASCITQGSCIASCNTVCFTCDFTCLPTCNGAGC